MLLYTLAVEVAPAQQKAAVMAYYATVQEQVTVFSPYNDTLYNDIFNIMTEKGGNGCSAMQSSPLYRQRHQI